MTSVTLGYFVWVDVTVNTYDGDFNNLVDDE